MQFVLLVDTTLEVQSKGDSGGVFSNLFATNDKLKSIAKILIGYFVPTEEVGKSEHSQSDLSVHIG